MAYVETQTISVTTAAGGGATAFSTVPDHGQDG